MARYHKELPVDDTQYMFTAVDHEQTVLLDIATQAADASEPVSIGQLAIPIEHLPALVRALPGVARDLIQAFASRRPRPAASAAYTQHVAAVRRCHPNAYQPWTDDQDQQLRARFNPDATPLTRHLDALAGVFGRQPSAIHARLVKLNLLPDPTSEQAS
jgi:hypothetical protein